MARVRRGTRQHAAGGSRLLFLNRAAWPRGRLHVCLRGTLRPTVPILTPSVPSVNRRATAPSRRSRPERARLSEVTRSRAERLGWLRVAPAMCAGQRAARAIVVVEPFLADVCRRVGACRRGGEQKGDLREQGRSGPGTRRRPSRTSSRVRRHPLPVRLRRRGVRRTLPPALAKVHEEP